MVENKNTFYLKDGKKLSDLKSLAKELISMSEDVYSHHVNKYKNDFSNWTKNSLKKEKLSNSIEGEINKIEMELKILRHLVHEKIKTKKKTIKKKIIKKKSSSNKASPNAGTIRVSTSSKKKKK